MKQILLVTALFSVITLSGQEFKNIDYQFNCGTNISIPYKKAVELWPEFEGHPKTTYSAGIGCFFELLVSYKLSSTLAVNSGLNYSFGKLKINDQIGFFESKGSINANYINIPLLISYQFSDKIPISISTGVYFGMLLSIKEKGTLYTDTSKFVIMDGPDPAIDAIEPVQKYNNNIKENYKKFDFGLSGQLDYKIGLNEKFSGIIFSRINYGLVNVLTNKLNTKSSADNWKNIQWMVGFGVTI